ncbi:MAG: hypothetical protein FWH36_04030, partial [Lentimicrobiaceae bacterium]|nr:hypothetical protein [Lentimicrobiaceae bacterium]
NYLIIRQLRVFQELTFQELKELLFQELKELCVETLRATSLRSCTNSHDFSLTQGNTKFSVFSFQKNQTLFHTKQKSQGQRPCIQQRGATPYVFSYQINNVNKIK